MSVPKKDKAFLLRMLALAAALPLATGCVSVYDSPAGAVLGSDFAQLTFEGGISDTVGFGYSFSQELSVAHIDAASRARRALWYGMTSKDPRSVLLPANKVAYLFATTLGFEAYARGYCKNRSKFTPRPNASYRVFQTAELYENCRIVVIDTATNLPPPDLEVIPYPVEN